MTESLHNTCLNFAPNSIYQEFYQALICGKEIISADSKLLDFKKLGIYHAIVVSGSHLVFLSLILEKTLKLTNKSILYPILFAYCLFTQAQPPVIRAFAQILVSDVQESRKWFWNDYEVSFVSTLLCLALNPSWTQSYSLLLSSAASLGLCFVRNKGILAQSLFIYCLLFIFIMPLSPPHPLSIFTNALFAPYIGLVLFPLSFLSFLVPHFYFLTDYLWNILFKASEIISNELPLMDSTWVSISTLWIILFIGQFYGILKDKRYFYQ